MNKEIEVIVSNAMKKSAFAQYSQMHQPEKDCDGEIECLVKRHSNFDKAENEMHALAATFNSLADYDNAIKNLDDTRENYKKKDALGSALKQFAGSVDSDDASDAVGDLMLPIMLTVKKCELSYMAAAYACLTLQWNSVAKYRPNLDIEEECSPDSITGIQIVSALNVMQTEGTLEKWKQLTMQESIGDRKLDFIKRTFLPQVK